MKEAERNDSVLENKVTNKRIGIIIMTYKFDDNYNEDYLRTSP